MSSSKLALKRARPALGSVLLMRLEAPAEMSERAIDEVIAQAFELSEELEEKFSKFREASDVSRINQASLGREIPVSREFAEVMRLATEIWRVSAGAFTPFGNVEECPIEVHEDRGYFFAKRTADATLDLSGIAKGFIVDRVCEFIRTRVPELSGVLNAGGDMRFFNMDQRQAEIRLAHGTEAIRCEVTGEALASSAMSEFLNNEASTTIYAQRPRPGLDESFVVSVMAETCAIADALTKAGWFGNPRAVEACADFFRARILIFDDHGHLTFDSARLAGEKSENPATP